ncbi:MAG: hypothetical protein EOO04_25840 [Chitinophagaceae bacterium]|nr:MAG: hypothetical protein EOO04_25840 [Chitinophagaceae bacterium]
MTLPWAICGIGIFFSLSGVYFVFKNSFEEGRSLKWPVFIILMGIVLIAIGTYKYVFPNH